MIYDLKEIAKKIREQLKTEFPACKWSVRMDNKGSRHITIALLKADRRIKQRIEEISNSAIDWYELRGVSKESLISSQNQSYHDLNHFVFMHDGYKPEVRNNGVFLTEGGFRLLKRVVEIEEQYNYDNSEPMTDYFDVNYYVTFSLGLWNYPFIDG